jgi:hypothetical protein
MLCMRHLRGSIDLLKVGCTGCLVRDWHAIGCSQALISSSVCSQLNPTLLLARANLSRALQRRIAARHCAQLAVSIHTLL